MRKEVTKTQIVTETKDVVVSRTVCCNKCGESYVQKTQYANDYDPNDYTNEHFWEAEIHEFNVGFGYGSKYDMESWQFDLCDDCLTDLVKSFRVVPNGFMCDGSSWLEGEEHQRVFDNWKETGDWDYLMGYTYEQLVKLDGYYKTEYINKMIEKYHPDKPLL
jgi:hypothetical protein